MGGFWANVYYTSAGLTDYYLDIDEHGTRARLTIQEGSIGGDEPWLESEEMMSIDEALQYVWPDEEAVADILKLSGKDHTEMLRKLGYKMEKTVRNCPQCGVQVADDYVYCHRCGTDLRILRCMTCQRELPKNAIFCPWCGKAQK